MHGDRAQLVASLDESILGLRPRPDFVDTSAHRHARARRLASIGMDEARAVLARLDRIEALERDGAPPGALLEELRGLVQAAEAWATTGRR